MRHILLILLLCVSSLVTSTATAESFVVDKVYHPYVLPFERKFEWRLSSRQNDNGNLLQQRLAFGHALSERVILEAYIVGSRDSTGNFGVSAYELETRWMLTEQGKYWADLGLLFEVEKQHHTDDWEATVGLLTEKEFGRTSLTTNVKLVYEWGQTVEDEVKGEFKLKYRYRWIPEIQPAVELYMSEGFTGLGPAFMGIKRFDGRKQLKWEVGFIAGLNGDAKDHTLRLNLEYDF